MKRLILLLSLFLGFESNAQNFQLGEMPQPAGDTVFIQNSGSGSLFPFMLDPDNFLKIEASNYYFGIASFTDDNIDEWKYTFNAVNTSISNWNSAHNWGNHSTQGYLKFSDSTILATKYFVNSRVITWSMVTGKPTFFSGDYNDLINRPTLFDGDYGSLTNKPNLFSGAYADLTGKPSLFSGAYSDLTGKPTLFSGSYIDLTSKPKIPSTYSGTTNSSGVYTVTFSEAYSVAPNIQANIVNQSNTNQFIRVTSISTTGFTINVFQRNSINLLGTDVLLFSTANVNGASVDVLITEK